MTMLPEAVGFSGEQGGGKRFSGAHLYAHSPLCHGLWAVLVEDVQAPPGDQQSQVSHGLSPELECAG